MASPGSWAATNGSGATQTTNAPASAPSGPTTSSFPTNMSAGEFSSITGVGQSEMPIFTGTNGQLNQSTAQLMLDYANMTQAERQQLQEQMVQAGRLSAGSATGVEDNSTARSAYVRLIGDSAGQGMTIQQYLSNVGQGGLGSLDNQISGNKSAAEKTLGSTAAVGVTTENASTLQAAITNAFDQTLGYAPSQEQVSAFVSAIQGQDPSYAEGANNQNRAQASAEVTQATAQQNSLKNLGPDGVDAFLTAFHNVVNGLPGGDNLQRGPQVGTAGQFTTALPGNKVLTPEEVKAQTTLPNGQPRMLNGAPMEVMDARNAQGQAVVTTNPGLEGPAAAAPVYGGEYALSPILWKQALDLLGAQGKTWEKKYTSPGQAPVQVQLTAVRTLAEHLYAQSVSLADVATHLAQGSPAAGKNVAAFANNMASQVGAQISQLQNQVNTTPDVTTHVTAPDANAEANLAAKAADPVGYYAANYASWGGLLSRMLNSGTPLNLMQSTADTFTGPVGSTGPAPAPGASGVPASSGAAA